jgi:uncharacterized protein (DUF1778 family)
MFQPMPKASSSHTARLEARLPADLHALLKRAADLQGRSLSDFVVSAARDAAVQAIRETEIVRLAVQDQETFVNALIEPPELPPAMERAAHRHRTLFGEA